MADSFLDWCKAREMAARSRFKRRGHKKNYAAEEYNIIQMKDVFNCLFSGLLLMFQFHPNLA
jgi:hypothetical protein